MRLTRFQRPSLWDLASSDPIRTLRNEIDRLFNESFRELASGTEFFNQWGPAVDIYEDNENLIVTAELPGMKKEDIDVSLHQGNLVIAGERKPEQQEGEPARTEIHYGRFQRAITLPKPVDAGKVSAAYKDGILTVTLPKTEEAKPKKIEVKVS